MTKRLPPLSAWRHATSTAGDHWFWTGPKGEVYVIQPDNFGGARRFAGLVKHGSSTAHVGGGATAQAVHALLASRAGARPGRGKRRFTEALGKLARQPGPMFQRQGADFMAEWAADQAREARQADLKKRLAHARKRNPWSPSMPSHPDKYTLDWDDDGQIVMVYRGEVYRLGADSKKAIAAAEVLADLGERGETARRMYRLRGKYVRENPAVKAGGSRYAPLNKAETATLDRIARSGNAGMPLAKLDLRHLGRLDRRGLIRMEGDPGQPGCKILLRNPAKRNPLHLPKKRASSARRNPSTEVVEVRDTDGYGYGIYRMPVTETGIASYAGPMAELGGIWWPLHGYVDPDVGRMYRTLRLPPASAKRMGLKKDAPIVLNPRSSR